MDVQIGFLGAGFIAAYHAGMLAHADLPVALVHDPDRERAAAFAARHGAAVADDVAGLLDGVDAAYVCTWTSEHPELVRAAATAGRAVFCEKPLGVDLDAATDVARAVLDAGVTNQVGLVLRDAPGMLALRHLIGRPESGPVLAVVFRDDQYLPTQGIYGSSWRADPDRAGSGTLLEHSIHDLDLLEWLVGPITSASARTAERHGLAGIEDVATATFEHAGGAVSSLTSVWHDVLARPSLRRIEVLCQRAWYCLEGEVEGPLHATVEGGDDLALAGRDLRRFVADEVVPLRNPDAAFVGAVAAGAPAAPAVQVALRAHVVADAAYRSADAGGAPVAVPVATPLG